MSTGPSPFRGVAAPGQEALNATLENIIYRIRQLEGAAPNALSISPYATGITDIVTIPGDGTLVDVEFAVSPNQIGLTAGGAPPQRDWTYPSSPFQINYLFWLYIFLSTLTGGETTPSFWYVKAFGSWTGQIFSFPVNPASGDSPGIFIPLPMFNDSVFGFQIAQDTGVDHTMNKGHFITYALNQVAP